MVLMLRKMLLMKLMKSIRLIKLIKLSRYVSKFNQKVRSASIVSRYGL